MLFQFKFFLKKPCQSYLALKVHVMVVRTTFYIFATLLKYFDSYPFHWLSIQPTALNVYDPTGEVRRLRLPGGQRTFS